MILPMLASTTACSAPAADPAKDPVQAGSPAGAENFPEYGRTPGRDCRERGLERFLGKPPTRSLVEEARIASGSASVRVVRPGDLITMDRRMDRLNLTLNKTGNVVGARCF